VSTTPKPKTAAPIPSTPEADGVPSLEDKRQARIAQQEAATQPIELSKGWQARGEALNAYAEAYLQAEAAGDPLLTISRSEEAPPRATGTPPPPGEATPRHESPVAVPLPTAPITPTPTPTWQEIERVIAARERAWQARVREGRYEWLDQEPLDYVRANVYSANSIDYVQAAADGNDNPLTEQMLNDPDVYPRGFLPSTFMVAADTVNQLLIYELRLDPSHTPNFEPVFFEELKTRYSYLYGSLQQEARTPDGESVHSFDSIFLEGFFDWILEPVFE
jgi:hypothetical protein